MQAVACPKRRDASRFSQTPLGDDSLSLLKGVCTSSKVEVARKLPIP